MLGGGAAARAWYSTDSAASVLSSQWLQMQLIEDTTMIGAGAQR